MIMKELILLVLELGCFSLRLALGNHLITTHVFYFFKELSRLVIVGGKMIFPKLSHDCLKLMRIVNPSGVY